MVVTQILSFVNDKVQHVQSAITPNYPIGDSILKPGDQTKITWLEDKNKPLLSSLPKVLIELMTGSDLNQISLQTIATVNAVLKTCDWTVPEVEPAGQNGPKPESGKNPGGVGHLVTSTTNNVTTSTNLNNNIETASTTKKNSLTSSNSFINNATKSNYDSVIFWNVIILSFVVLLSNSLLIKN
ncbi:1601_t:CDS:2 [Diversispora eburnea]|uniref:1601_t:CDS:1 n=1 Tax=Diversispora eburnea TaxID=1213867 RepID=A0A9N8V638_9GLOM|nr:1601_t:CDS:2 [Diversispora eburnea]